MPSAHARAIAAGLLLCLAAAAQTQLPPEPVYRGELLSYPGPWSFQLGKPGIILVTDEELEALADPDKVLNLATGYTPRLESLRQICERAQAAGQRTLMLAFDHFFKQYRPGTEKPRRLLPDMDEYIGHIARIGRFAQGYGLGLELSLLSPLEVGKTFAARTGESGLWMQYRKGLRDPKTGAFSVEFWLQRQWANNKGPIEVTPAGVRVFAFHETPVPGTPYRAVDPASIVEIGKGIEVQIVDGIAARSGDYRAQRVRVYSSGGTGQPGLDRVLVVQQYRTPEMDYFSPKALPFLTTLVDRYASAGVKLNALYADEMHIQGDWAYFSHLDSGSFTLRYASRGLEKKFAEQYGAEYSDLAKFMLYFVYGQDDFAHDLSAKQGIMHVFGASPEQIRKTALFRSRYYRMLEDGVIDLFVQAKHHAEQKMGQRLEARAHATWAESPTIDHWDTGRQNQHRSQYEYTSNFVWSNTVQQAATACDDYFRWGDFLTGNGNDHAEGGWLDRNYFALALACSTGILNDVPYSYAAHWGMPDQISTRRSALEAVYGVGGAPVFGLVEEMEHRDVDVLMLYPMDLVAVEERFGSWMAQYGYANMVTATKLVERGKVINGAIEMAGRRFHTLAAMFEPFPSKKLLAMMEQLTAQGGRVIWSGPPPVMNAEGEPALSGWQKIFGVAYQPDAAEGLIAPGKQIRFEGPLASVAPQIILTDFLVDHIYPVKPVGDALPAARVKDLIVATVRRPPGGGTAAFLGYRPRDDQSRSLGYESRNWFEVLDALGAYPGADNTERVSRTTPYLTARFPNGAIAIAPHLREVEEGWEGGFARNATHDRDYMERNPPPPDAIHLENFRVNGHAVSYEGAGALAFRVDAAGRLTAFAGERCRKISIDGRETIFADRDLAQIGWAPVAAARRQAGGAVLQIQARGSGQVRIPAPAGTILVAEGRKPGSRGKLVPFTREQSLLVFTLSPEISGQWLYLVPDLLRKR